MLLKKAVTGSGSSVRTPSGQQGRDRWYAVRLRPDSGRRTPLPCRAHQGYRGYGIEGGVPGTLGTPLSLLETLWASINETSMKQGAHLMTPMTYLTLLFNHSTPTATVKSFLLKGLKHLVLLALLISQGIARVRRKFTDAVVRNGS